MASKTSAVSEGVRRAATPPSARRALPRPTATRQALAEGEDGRRPVGRYDGRRAPLPPGDALATTPREDSRRNMRKRLKRLRGAIRCETAAERKAIEDGATAKAARAVRTRCYLEGEERRLQQTLAEMGEELAVAGVEDPMGDGKRLVKVAVNGRVDVLEDERSRHLISEAGYRTGRIVEAVFERMGRVGGSNWCGASRIDPALANEIKMIRALQDAATVDELMERIRGRLGEIDTRLLRRILGERMSFADCAALIGRAGDRGQRYCASRYRDALEELSEAWTFRGAARPVPDDKHAAAAAAAGERQELSLIGGATIARLQEDLEALEGGAPIAEDLNRPREIERTRDAIADQRLRQGLARARRAPAARR